MDGKTRSLKHQELETFIVNANKAGQKTFFCLETCVPTYPQYYQLHVQWTGLGAGSLAVTSIKTSLVFVALLFIYKEIIDVIVNLLI